MTSCKGEMIHVGLFCLKGDNYSMYIVDLFCFFGTFVVKGAYSVYGLKGDN